MLVAAGRKFAAEKSSRKYGKELRMIRDDVSDIFRGRDYVVNGVPVDVTLKFRKKDHTEVMGTEEYGTESKFCIDYGYRYGNNEKTFDLPVLVIGVTDLSGHLTQGEEWAIREFSGYLDRIIEIGTDLYWQFTDKIEFENAVSFSC